MLLININYYISQDILSQAPRYPQGFSKEQTLSADVDLS